MARPMTLNLVEIETWGSVKSDGSLALASKAFLNH